MTIASFCIFLLFLLAIRFVKYWRPISHVSLCMYFCNSHHFSIYEMLLNVLLSAPKVLVIYCFLDSAVLCIFLCKCLHLRWELNKGFQTRFKQDSERSRSSFIYENSSHIFLSFLVHFVFGNVLCLNYFYNVYLNFWWKVA